MDLIKELDRYLEYQRVQVDKLLQDISIPKEGKNAQMRKIVDLKKLVDEFRAKFEYINQKEYQPSCDG